jgi:hypothetical protein
MVSGEAPYGWTRDRHGQLGVDPVEQIVVARIRELRTKGLSDRQVALRLNKEGVRARGTPVEDGDGAKGPGSEARDGVQAASEKTGSLK